MFIIVINSDFTLTPFVLKVFPNGTVSPNGRMDLNATARLFHPLNLQKKFGPSATLDRSQLEPEMLFFFGI